MSTGLGTRHAALLRRETALQLATVPTEMPSRGGVLVEMSHVGVCGTDLQILNGARPDVAEILGHEGCGTVIRAGVGAPLEAGQRVTFNPAAQLASGQLLGHNTPGLFQRRITLDARAVAEGVVLGISEEIPPVCGALIEPLGAVVYAYQMISRVVRELRTVLVMGAGPIGLLATAYLRSMGLNVLLVHTNRVRLDHAVALGLVAARATHLSSGHLVQELLTENRGEWLDAALICTTRAGAPVALANAMRLVRHGGCIDVVANYPESAAAPGTLTGEAIRAVRGSNVCGTPLHGHYLTTEFHARQIMLTGHRGTHRDHLIRAAQALRSTQAPYSRLITHVLSLEEAAHAIGHLAHSHTRQLSGRDCIKAVIDMHG